MGQFVYTKLISNNHALFQLRWKENFVKHQKVSKYYEKYCWIRQSFSLYLRRLQLNLNSLKGFFYKIKLKNYLRERSIRMLALILGNEFRGSCYISFLPYPKSIHNIWIILLIEYSGNKRREETYIKDV